MRDSDGCGCLLYLVLFVVAVVVSLLFVKWIGESDLPFWMKYWLLKKGESYER